MSEYPAREKFYAHRLTRLLFKSCAAQSIGQDAVLLIIHIAHTEDAARYQGPVRFWNSQLSETLGFRSPKTLNNARAKAIESGWLVYERKNDRTDGKYFTCIPRSVLEFDDAPIEPSSVSDPERVPESFPVSIPSTESFPSTEHKAEQESYALRNGKVTGNDPPPNPTPIPNPKERDASLPPTIEEVTAECAKKNYRTIDPARWWSFWDSKFWTDKNGRMIKWESRLMNDNLTPKPAWMVAAEKAAEEESKPSRYQLYTKD